MQNCFSHSHLFTAAFLSSLLMTTAGCMDPAVPNTTTVNVAEEKIPSRRNIQVQPSSGDRSNSLATNTSNGKPSDNRLRTVESNSPGKISIEIGTHDATPSSIKVNQIQGLPRPGAISDKPEQREQDEKALVEASIRARQGNVQIIKWYEPEPYYAALIGQQGKPQLSGIAEVFSRADAEKEVEHHESLIREAFPNGQPRPGATELRGLGRIGSRIKVRYIAGGQNFEDTYIVRRQAQIVGGALKLGANQAQHQASGSW